MNFFEETFGCLAEYPLDRPPQGEFETGNALHMGLRSETADEKPTDVRRHVRDRRLRRS
jgi:hypothetical protein